MTLNDIPRAERKPFKNHNAVRLCTYAEIALLLKVTPRTLFYWRKELNLPTRPRGRRKP